MSNPPALYRPIFQTNLYQSERGMSVSSHIANQARRYNVFLRRVIAVQRRWAERVRELGCDVTDAKLAEFETHPCINNPVDGDQLECIEAGEDGCPLLGYVYLPRHYAETCVIQGGLAAIPDYMCFEARDLMRFVALDIPPTSDRSFKDNIVEEYHRMGCDQVDEDDIEHVLTIPLTDFMRRGGAAYSRSRPLTFDIVANTPVIPI